MGMNNLASMPSMGEGQVGGPTEAKLTRGLATASHALVGEHHNAHKDKPGDFKPIRIEDMTDGIEGILKSNGFMMKSISLGGDQLGQMLIYRQEDIDNASRYKGGSPPKGVKVIEGKGYAIPVLWTDSLTEKVLLTYDEDDGSVTVMTKDRPEEGSKTEELHLFRNHVYTKEAWRKAKAQANATVGDHLAAPDGAPTNSNMAMESNAMTWNEEQGYGNFRPNGLYSSPPGTRYGFMGWVKQKKHH